METVDKLSDSVDLTEYASRIIHPLVRVLDTTPELRYTAMDTLSAIVVQMGRRYEIFIPMVNKVLLKHKVGHRRYDILLCNITQVLWRDLFLAPIMQEHVLFQS